MFRLTTLLALLSLGLGAFAQTPVAPPLPVQPVAAPVAAPPTAGQDTVALQFPNADVTQVLDYYERLTNKRLIRDNQVIGQVNIVINQPIPRDEAIKIIEINLLMNGFSLVPASGNIWKVIGTGKNPRNFGIPIFSEADMLPDSEQVVTFLAKLQYADPTEIAQVLGQAIPASPNLGQTITPLPKAGALLITENTVIIKGILRILREIDLPPAEVESTFFTLQRADAKTVLEKLQDIIAPKTQAGTPNATTSAVPRPAQPRGSAVAVTPEGLPLPPQPNATVEVTGPGTIEVNSGRVLSEDAVVVGKTILQADERTNRIHIVTRPVNLKFFRKLIDQLDADTIFGEPVTRPLKFVSAGDIMEALKKAVSDPGAKEDGAAGGTRPGGQANRGNTGNQSNLTNNDRFSNSNSGFGGSGSGGTGGFSESLNTQERDVVPEAYIIGNTKIIADKRANAIIVIGNKDVQQKVFAFLDQIDVRAPQVTIHTVIGALSLDNSEQFGVEYILKKEKALGNVTTTTTGPSSTGSIVTGPSITLPVTTDTGTTAGVVNNGSTTASTSTSGGILSTTANLVVNPAAIGAPAGINLTNILTNRAVTQLITGGSSGLGGFFTVGNALDIIVSALTSTGRFKVTASPSIFTSNNKKAVISSGTEIAVPTSITSGNNGSVNGNLGTTASVQYKTVALQLEVLPLINADGEVELEVIQKIDELTGVSDTVSGNAIPRIATRVLKTTVTVPNGATIVLGGLRRELDTKTTKGIPYLSQIPYLGALFRSTTGQKTREELVIILRPVVTTGPREIIEQRERELEGFQIGPDIESTLTPKNTRKGVPADQTFRKDLPVLRAEPVAKAKR